MNKKVIQLLFTEQLSIKIIHGRLNVRVFCIKRAPIPLRSLNSDQWLVKGTQKLALVTDGSKETNP